MLRHREREERAVDSEVRRPVVAEGGSLPQETTTAQLDLKGQVDPRVRVHGGEGQGLPAVLEVAQLHVDDHEGGGEIPAVPVDG